MKIFNQARSLAALLLFGSLSSYAQSVFPGKQTIDKIEYLGLILNQNIPQKHIEKYWDAYLGKFGKVKNRRAVYSIEKASLPSVSPGPVLLLSEVSSKKKEQSQVFMALNVGGQYIANYSDDASKGAESILKEFANYAAAQDEVRLADELFTTTEKSYQRLLKDNENTAREIERTEKKLADLKTELEKKKVEANNSLIDLQNKQKALELVKSKNSTPK